MARPPREHQYPTHFMQTSSSSSSSSSSSVSLMPIDAGEDSYKPSRKCLDLTIGCSKTLHYCFICCITPAACGWCRCVEQVGARLEVATCRPADVRVEWLP